MSQVNHKTHVDRFVSTWYARSVQDTDRRVRRTRAALGRALLELAGERPFEGLTVRELVDRADVGYATFFRHYANKEALLLDVFGGIVGELATLLEPTAEEGRLDDAGRQLFDYVARNEGLLRPLFAAQLGTAVEREVRAAVEARVLASRGFRPPADVPAALAAHHLAVASLALVAWWLEHGMPYGSERMGRIYARLVVAPVGGG
jgi:AcrR family transcriptional regulator